MISPSKRKTVSARRRAQKNHRIYRRIASFVLAVRKHKGMTQREFAALLGVSEISVRRWETALGHKPNSRVWDLLKEYQNVKPGRRKTVHRSKR